jgi:hypothetical protein
MPLYRLQKMQWHLSFPGDLKTSGNYFHIFFYSRFFTPDCNITYASNLRGKKTAHPQYNERKSFNH